MSTSFLIRATTVTHAPESIGGCPVFLPPVRDNNLQPLVHEWVTDPAILHDVDCPRCLRAVQSLNEEGIGRLTYIALIMAMLAALITALSLITASEAQAAPYGGCKEAFSAPQSPGAKECRDKGWTVRSRLVANPNGRVKYLAPSLPACEREDSRNCWWDADAFGNGKGSDFVNLGGKVFKVKGVRA